MLKVMEQKRAEQQRSEEPKTAERWYTVDKICEITSLGKSFIYAEMQAGRLKSKKIGAARRISESQLAEWQGKFNGAGEAADQI